MDPIKREMSNNTVSQKSHPEPEGNTKTSDSKTNQLYLWMITIPVEPENENAEDLATQLKEFCKKFVFQKEKGESTGYVHWQVFISLKTKERFCTVKNLFPSKAHIEPCRDGWKASQYCKKTDTRLEGPYDEKTEFIKSIKELYPWQAKLRDELLTDPEDRKIKWIWDKEGNKGKTQFCKYMIMKHGATVLGNGQFKDIAQALPSNPKIVLFNVTRDLEDRINYSALEAVKDGLMFSGKYESRMKVFNSPHVVIFANFEPKKTAMSKDRWDIEELS